MRLTAMSRSAAAALTLFALASVGMSAQSRFTLESLTVPSSRLPAGCTLQSPMTTNAAPVHLGPTFTTNPWQGNTHQELLFLQSAVEGGVKMPDAPPPSRRELAAMQERLLANLAEGYRALYSDARGTIATVVALRYKDGNVPLWSALNRFVFGSTAALLRVESKGDCSDAIESHLRSLK